MEDRRVTKQKRGNKHRIGAFNFKRFVHAESLGEIHPQSIGGTTEAIPHENRSEHAGLSKLRLKVYEYYHY